MEPYNTFLSCDIYFFMVFVPFLFSFFLLYFFSFFNSFLIVFIIVFLYFIRLIIGFYSYNNDNNNDCLETSNRLLAAQIILR